MRSVLLSSASCHVHPSPRGAEGVVDRKAQVGQADEARKARRRRRLVNLPAGAAACPGPRKPGPVPRLALPPVQSARSDGEPAPPQTTVVTLMYYVLLATGKKLVDPTSRPGRCAFAPDEKSPRSPGGSAPASPPQGPVLGNRAPGRRSRYPLPPRRRCSAPSHARRCLGRALY